MAKYLIVFDMGLNQTGECEPYEGTLENAIAEATASARHKNYGRRGAKIYQVGEPVYSDPEIDAESYVNNAPTFNS